MLLKSLTQFLAVVLLCCLLNSCRSSFHLVLFNDTDDTLVLRLRPPQGTPLVIIAGISGDITGLSTEDLTVERKGKLLHYRFPSNYAYPSPAVSSIYQRNILQLGQAFCFQIAQDNRIYILRRREKLENEEHLIQPAGFPLRPH